MVIFTPINIGFRVRTHNNLVRLVNSLFSRTNTDASVLVRMPMYRRPHYSTQHLLSLSVLHYITLSFYESMIVGILQTEGAVVFSEIHTTHFHATSHYSLFIIHYSLSFPTHPLFIIHYSLSSIPPLFFATAHSRFRDRALSALRVRTLGPATAHSRPRECALAKQGPTAMLNDDG